MGLRRQLVGCPRIRLRGSGSDSLELREGVGGSFDADVDLHINIVKAVMNSGSDSTQAPQ